ncbi:Myb-like domain [Phytophthora cactorum]|nr:Myb-like domain [Phytophthora cactorum]
MADVAPSSPEAESGALDTETDEDTIAGRTRTKFSLVDVPIDTLEASLPDAALELEVPETEEDREYQRFLSSLLPNEQVNLSFLDEEDEEYKPEEEEDDHEDEDARRADDLLLDSTHMTFPKLPVAIAATVPTLEPNREELLAVDNSSEGVLPISASVAGDVGKEVAAAFKQPACRAMIEELQQRGEKALKYKNELLSKLNPAMAGTEGNNGNNENLLALRRVTRSLTAAHAAVAHPSMFELVGSQTVDELSAGFARGCSLEERDHCDETRKSKKGYSTTEDILLAHGAKRFGTQADSWEQIQKHFLPTKTTQNLRHRYKYLTSPKIAMNAVKALHLKAQPQHHSNSWLLEEDLRIARGLVELHKENRLEIRKRWERLAAKFRSDLAEIGLTAPEDDSLDLAVAMKEYLEDNLRNRMLRQRGEAEKAKLDAALQLQQLGQGMRGSLMGHSAKNLHPALFFSSWSFISPATLLNSTCKHNWPSFMDEGNDAKDKLHKDQLNAGRANARVYAARDAVRSRWNPATDMTRMPQATILMDARMARKESEEDDDSDYEHDELLSSENEGSDSEFEQMEFTDDDEVDEDGDDEASGDTFEQDTLMSDSDDQSVLSVNSLWAASGSPPPSPSHGKLSSKEASSDPRIRHPLRLKNLGQPGNERMKRALAALERRIVGKSVDSSAPSSVTNSQTGSSKRAKRKVTSTLVGPLGANRSTNNGAFAADTGEHTQTAIAETGSDEDDEDDDDWKDGSGDEEFEVVELPSSSDEFALASSDEDDESPRHFPPASTQDNADNTKPAPLMTTTPRREAPDASFNSNELPNKKAKLQQCPTCGHSTCTCSSSERMQLLLRRMKEKRSSSSLQ